MSDGLSFLLVAGGVAGVGVGLYLLIRLGDWCSRLWNARSDRLAVQHGECVVNRLKAQFGKSTDTRRSTGQTRLGRRGTPDAAAAETATWTVLHKLGLDEEPTTTIPAIRESHPGITRGVDRTSDLARAMGTHRPAARYGFDRQPRAGMGSVPTRSPSGRDAASPPIGGGEWPTTWAASA
jgi:hypothetical protein